MADAQGRGHAASNTICAFIGQSGELAHDFFQLSPVLALHDVRQPSTRTGSAGDKQVVTITSVAVGFVPGGTSDSTGIDALLDRGPALPTQVGVGTATPEATSPTTHQLLAAACSNATLIIRLLPGAADDSSATSPVLRVLPWFPDFHKRIISMDFSPMGDWLLCLSLDASVHCLPVMSLLSVSPRELHQELNTQFYRTAMSSHSSIAKSATLPSLASLVLQRNVYDRASVTLPMLMQSRAVTVGANIPGGVALTPGSRSSRSTTPGRQTAPLRGTRVQASVPSESPGMVSMSDTDDDEKLPPARSPDMAHDAALNARSQPLAGTWRSLTPGARTQERSASRTSEPSAIKADESPVVSTATALPGLAHETGPQEAGTRGAALSSFAPSKRYRSLFDLYALKSVALTSAGAAGAPPDTGRRSSLSQSTAVECCVWWRTFTGQDYSIVSCSDGRLVFINVKTSAETTKALPKGVIALKMELLVHRGMFSEGGNDRRDYYTRYRDHLNPEAGAQKGVSMGSTADSPRDRWRQADKPPLRKPAERRRGSSLDKESSLLHQDSEEASVPVRLTSEDDDLNQFQMLLLHTNTGYCYTMLLEYREFSRQPLEYSFVRALPVYRSVVDRGVSSNSFEPLMVKHFGDKDRLSVQHMNGDDVIGVYHSDACVLALYSPGSICREPRKLPGQVYRVRHALAHVVLPDFIHAIDNSDVHVMSAAAARIDDEEFLTDVLQPNGLPVEDEQSRLPLSQQPYFPKPATIPPNEDARLSLAIVQAVSWGPVRQAHRNALHLEAKGAGETVAHALGVVGLGRNMVAIHKAQQGLGAVSSRNARFCVWTSNRVFQMAWNGRCVEPIVKGLSQLLSETSSSNDTVAARSSLPPLEGNRAWLLARVAGLEQTKLYKLAAEAAFRRDDFENALQYFEKTDIPPAELIQRFVTAGQAGVVWRFIKQQWASVLSSSAHRRTTSVGEALTSPQKQKAREVQRGAALAALVQTGRRTLTGTAPQSAGTSPEASSQSIPRGEVASGRKARPLQVDVGSARRSSESGVYDNRPLSPFVGGPSTRLPSEAPWLSIVSSPTPSSPQVGGSSVARPAPRRPRGLGAAARLPAPVLRAGTPSKAENSSSGVYMFEDDGVNQDGSPSTSPRQSRSRAMAFEDEFETRTSGLPNTHSSPRAIERKGPSHTQSPSLGPISSSWSGAFYDRSTGPAVRPLGGGAGTGLTPHAGPLKGGDVSPLPLGRPGVSYSPPSQTWQERRRDRERLGGWDVVDLPTASDDRSGMANWRIRSDGLSDISGEDKQPDDEDVEERAHPLSQLLLHCYIEVVASNRLRGVLHSANAQQRASAVRIEEAFEVFLGTSVDYDWRDAMQSLSRAPIPHHLRPTSTPTSDASAVAYAATELSVRGLLRVAHSRHQIEAALSFMLSQNALPLSAAHVQYLLARGYGSMLLETRLGGHVVRTLEPSLRLTILLEEMADWNSRTLQLLHNRRSLAEASLSAAAAAATLGQSPRTRPFSGQQGAQATDMSGGNANDIDDANHGVDDTLSRCFKRQRLYLVALSKLVPELGTRSLLRLALFLDPFPRQSGSNSSSLGLAYLWVMTKLGRDDASEDTAATSHEIGEEAESQLQGLSRLRCTVLEAYVQTTLRLNMLRARQEAASSDSQSHTRTVFAESPSERVSSFLQSVAGQEHGQAQLEKAIVQLVQRWTQPSLLLRVVRKSTEHHNWAAAAIAYETAGKWADALEFRLLQTANPLSLTALEGGPSGHVEALRALLDITHRQEKEQKKDSEATEESKQPDTAERAAILRGLVSTHVIRVENEDERLRLLRSIFRRWVEFGLHRDERAMSQLEEYFLQSDVLAVLGSALCLALFESSDTANANEAPGVLCVPEFSSKLKLAVIQQRLRAPLGDATLVSNGASDETGVRPNAEQLSTSTSPVIKALRPQEAWVWQQVLSNLNAPMKNAASGRCIRLAHPEQLAGELMIFSCGHNYTRKAFRESALPRLALALSQLPMPLSITSKLLMAEYEQDVMHAACPACLERSIQSQQQQLLTSERERLKLLQAKLARRQQGIREAVARLREKEKREEEEALRLVSEAQSLFPTESRG